jgi:hypothetical protein
MAGTGGGSASLRVGASATGSAVDDLKSAMAKGIAAIKGGPKGKGKPRAKGKSRAEAPDDEYSMQRELHREMVAAGMEDGRTAEICSKFAHDLIGTCYGSGEITEKIVTVEDVPGSVSVSALSASSGEFDVLSIRDGVLYVRPYVLYNDAGAMFSRKTGRSPRHTFMVGLKIAYKGGSDIHRMDAVAKGLKTGHIHYGGGGQHVLEATDLHIDGTRSFKLLFRVPDEFTIPETTEEHVRNIMEHASPHELLGISKVKDDQGKEGYLLHVRGGHVVNPMLQKLLEATIASEEDPNHLTALGVVRAAKSSAAADARIPVSEKLGNMMWTACSHAQKRVSDRHADGVKKIPRAFEASDPKRAYPIGTVDGMIGAPGTDIVLRGLFVTYASGENPRTRRPMRRAWGSDSSSDSDSGSGSSSGSSSSDSGGAE